MYTAMADIAGKTGEPELLQACETLWDNITQKRMYVTGSIGSTVDGEAFSIDYDLPNDTAYAETCAAIGLVFFARKMLDIHPSGKYADVMERALYNGVLSGMQLDGKKFFYVNPLEADPDISGKLYGFKHVLPERPGWYSCACCPPNVVRLVMSLGKYAWSCSEDTIYSHLYLGGSASFAQAVIDVESSYPWEGRVSYTVNPVRENQQFALAVRIPSYAKDYRILLNGEERKDTFIEDGYFYLSRTWQTGDKVELLFSMPVRKIYCNTAVRENEGCVALMRGPLVYCFEGIDNDGCLQELRIPENTEFISSFIETEQLKGMIAIKFDGIRMRSKEALYLEEQPEQEKVRIKAIPYFAWGNRGLNQMRVWMLEK